MVAQSLRAIVAIHSRPGVATVEIELIGRVHVSANH